MAAARDAVLNAFIELERTSGTDTFRIGQLWLQVKSSTSAFKESTIRTYVTSAMCVNAPVHHANHTDDLVRVGLGLYRRTLPTDDLAALRSAADSRGNRALESPQPHREDASMTGDAQEEWHWEGNVQAMMVAHLARAGWAIQSVANTSTKERGVDIIASKDQDLLLVEVKGYPSLYYAHGANKGKVKKTAPSIQARVWFADLIMSSMLNAGEASEADIVLGLPDFPTYRGLFDRVSPSLTRLRFSTAWVRENGEVDWTGVARP